MHGEYKTSIKIFIISRASFVYYVQASHRIGHGMAQAVSHQPPTAEAGVHAEVNPYRICCGRSGTRTGFLQVLHFSPVNTIPPFLSKLM
jgi:hypothetical protein